MLKIIWLNMPIANKINTNFSIGWIMFSPNLIITSVLTPSSNDFENFDFYRLDQPLKQVGLVTHL